MADELSMFDPETFMSSEFEGAMSTSLILIPQQDWPARIVVFSKYNGASRIPIA